MPFSCHTNTHSDSVCVQLYVFNTQSSMPTYLCCSLIDEVYRLVWQLPVRQVCIRQGGCSSHCCVSDAHTVVVLVPADMISQAGRQPHTQSGRQADRHTSRQLHKHHARTQLVHERNVSQRGLFVRPTCYAGSIPSRTAFTPHPHPPAACKNSCLPQRQALPSEHHRAIHQLPPPS
jgi:hypothetical protein